jgi:hypothetical protein
MGAWNNGAGIFYFTCSRKRILKKQIQIFLIFALVLNKKYARGQPMTVGFLLLILIHNLEQKRLVIYIPKS